MYSFIFQSADSAQSQKNGGSGFSTPCIKATFKCSSSDLGKIFSTEDHQQLESQSSLSVHSSLEESAMKELRVTEPIPITPRSGGRSRYRSAPDSHREGCESPPKPPLISLMSSEAMNIEEHEEEEEQMVRIYLACQPFKMP